MAEGEGFGLTIAPRCYAANLGICLSTNRKNRVLRVPATKLRRETANRTRSKSTLTRIGQAPESVNHELIFRQISPIGEPANQSMRISSHEKRGCTQMTNSNDVASNAMLWERVWSLLVVGASVLGGSTLCK
jgi:hypothetical protein